MNLLLSFALNTPLGFMSLILLSLIGLCHGRLHSLVNFLEKPLSSEKSVEALSPKWIIQQELELIPLLFGFLFLRLSCVEDRDSVLNGCLWIVDDATLDFGTLASYFHSFIIYPPKNYSLDESTQYPICLLERALSSSNCRCCWIVC